MKLSNVVKPTGKNYHTQLKRHGPTILKSISPTLHPWEGIVQHPIPNLEGIQSVITARHEQNDSIEMEVFITNSCLDTSKTEPVIPT